MKADRGGRARVNKKGRPCGRPSKAHHQGSAGWEPEWRFIFGLARCLSGYELRCRRGAVLGGASEDHSFEGALPTAVAFAA